MLKDINAAINILKLALSTVRHTGIYAWGDLLDAGDWSNSVVSGRVSEPRIPATLVQGVSKCKEMMPEASRNLHTSPRS